MSENSWISEACNRQSEYNDVFSEWRVFDRDHTDYIKSMIGLMLFGIEEGIENPPPTVSYFQVYNANNRTIINTVYNHIKNCEFRDEIFLSCTYLVGRTKNGEIFSFPVLRYSRSPSDQVYFTEVSGRKYVNWEDFIASNQLPSCDFVAPSNGLYTEATPTYVLYKSPASSSNRGVMNTVASVGALACAAASFCTVVPATVLTLGFGISVYGVGQSISNLCDRRSHGQSIALNNRESLLSYGNIAATGLAGASFAVFSNLGRLQRISGNYANAVTRTCRVLNLSTIVLDSGFLLISAYDFFEKLRTHTITHEDVFNLTLQIFLVCGALVQAREVNNLLKQSSSSGVINKKLTKTQKRNLQKRRAKARARGEEHSGTSTLSSSETTTLPIGENDAYSSLKRFSLKVSSFGVNVLLTMFPRSEIILTYYYDLRDLITATFINKTMEMRVFLQQIFYHSRNLYTIIRQDITRMREILRQFIPDPHINDNELIAQTINNELDRINMATEELMPTLQLNAIENAANQDNENDRVNLVGSHYDLILNFVQEICCKYKTKDTADGQISFFHAILVLITNYLDENCVKLFEKASEISRKITDTEKAEIMMSVLGMKSENDFHPTANFLVKVLEDSTPIREEFVNNLVDTENQEDTCSLLGQHIFQQYSQLIRNVCAQVIAQKKGIHQTIRILQHLSTAIENKLGGECRKMSFDSHSLYEENKAILGEVIADEMMKAIEMPRTELEFFQSAIMQLKIDDLVSEVNSQNECLNNCTQTAFSPVQEEQEEKYEQNIVKLIGALFVKVKESESGAHFKSKPELFIKVTNFIFEKLISELQLDAQLYEQLEINVNYVGPKLLKAMREAIGMYAVEKSCVFKTKAQLLGRENNLRNLLAEFCDRYSNTQSDLQQPKIFETTIGDDGFTTYKIICDQNGSNEAYKELVYLLFKINVDKLDCKIERDKRCVVVKSKNKVITFTFPGEENIALVILTDLDCKEM